MINRPLQDWEYPEPDEDDRGYDEEYSDGYAQHAAAAELRPCPHCGSEIYEESERCPVCSQYVSFNNGPLSGRPWWFVLLGLLGIGGVIWAMVVS